MQTPLPKPTATLSTATRSLRSVFLLVALVLLARIVYLVWFCRYDLVEDEAHYWLWSRYLDWSYYSKGPGVAWAIRASTAIFGEREWAVRLPTAIASAIGALAIGALARDLAADAHDHARQNAVGGSATTQTWASPARVGFLAALAYTLAPALQGTAIVMTIDGPYIACWSVACWAFWRAVRGSVGSGVVCHVGCRGGVALDSATSAACIVADSEQSTTAPGSSSAMWLLVGAAIGLGFLFKYTILLLIPGLLVFVLLTRRKGTSTSPERGVPRARRVCQALAALLILAGVAPVVYWNAQSHWPTIKHLLGHLGVAGGDMPVTKGAVGGTKWSPWWLPDLIGQQIALIGPWLFLGAIPFWRCVPRLSEPDLPSSSPNPPEDSRRRGRTFLICAAAPILLFYIVVSLITEPEGNWPMAAYATLLPLAAWIAADALAARAAARARGERAAGPITLRVRLWRIGMTYALIAALFVHKLDWVGNAALALDKKAWFHDRFHRMLGRDPHDPAVHLRDPAGRVRGAKVMAAHVNELLAGLRDGTQREPFVIAQHYGRASQLAYYLRFGPRPWTEVLCAMHGTGGRESQFDYWPQTKLDRPELLGRPAIIITSVRPYMTDIWRTMFAEVRPIPEQRLRGESKSDRSAMLGFAWKGVGGVGGKSQALEQIESPSSTAERRATHTP